MRRVALLSLLVAIVVSAPLAASADPITPSGLRLSSPPEAASGQLMWIRSVSPCPAASSAQVHRFVEAWVLPQAGALGSDLGEVTGDVDDAGNWQVTLMAPNGPTAGATAHFYVRAACLEDDPWAAAPLDGDANVPPIAVAYYEVNPLWVTSSGGGGSDGKPSEFIPDPSQFATTTTTTTAEATTKTATVAATTKTATVAAASVDDAKARAAAIRKELAAQGVDTSRMSDVQVLLASPASSSTSMPDDPGIPWWAFAFASMLAVGAVVAWGARRAGPHGL